MKELSKTYQKLKQEMGIVFLQQIDSFPNCLKLGMDVEICLRNTHKEECLRTEEVANNLFPLWAIHVIVKEDAMLPLIGR